MNRGTAEVLAEEPVSTPLRWGGVTRRSVLIGLLLVCGEVAIISFSEPVARSSSMNISHFPVGFFMGFVAIVLFLNPLLKRVDVRYALTPAELLTAAAIGLIGSHVPGSGLLGFFLGTLAAPYYFASPENRWGELLHPNIPSWLAPVDEGGALQGFFEGAAGHSIPWQAWAIPLFWWMCLIGALTFALLCIAVMLRRQWVENERLVYPLISPVEDLIAGSGSPGLLPQVARSRLFWVGFGIGFGILAWNIVAYFWEGWPRINYFGRKDWVFLRNFPWMTSRINMYIIGFGYFANVDVLSSLWFFYLFYWAEKGIFNRIGYDLGPGTGNVAVWKSAGGLFALVGWGLWVARGHLKDVVRKALNPACEVDDRGEMLSYRTALFGFLVGTAVVVLWLSAAGMQPGVAALLLLAMYVAYVGLAKVVSESGLLYLAWTVSPQALVTGALGSVTMAPGSVTAMAFTDGLRAHGKGIFMSGFAQGAKMADLTLGNRRRLALGMALALLAGIPLCLYLSLGWGYEYGAYNFGGTPFRAGQGPFQRAVADILSPQGVAYKRLMFFGIGIGMMSLLTLLRYRLPWWPLNPIGFAIAGNGRATKSVFSVFLVWAFKFLILRVGGVALYRRYRALFVGLLSGYSLGVGVSFFVDVIWFPGHGHWIHLY